MTYEELTSELTWTPSPTSVPTISRHIVVGGMGGSTLPAYALRFFDPAFPISVHHDYDLPENASADALYVALSYSGSTAETLSFARAALKRGFSLAIIASGGELGELAKEKNLPFVEIPSGLQPRNALFYQLRALLALIKRDDPLAKVSFDPSSAEKEAEALAKTLTDALPIFYASRANGFLAYVAKIHMNEGAKMPAFADLFPELNHNEMQSFDTMAPKAVAALARFVLFYDENDDARITKRMNLFADLMRERGRSVTTVTLSGTSRAEKLVRTWYLLHRTAVSLAERRGIDPNAIPLIEDFKRRL